MSFSDIFQNLFQRPGTKIFLLPPYLLTVTLLELQFTSDLGRNSLKWGTEKLHFSKAAAKSREKCRNLGEPEKILADILSKIFVLNRPKSRFFVRNLMSGL